MATGWCRLGAAAGGAKSDKKGGSGPGAAATSRLHRKTLAACMQYTSGEPSPGMPLCNA